MAALTHLEQRSRWFADRRSWSGSGVHPLSGLPVGVRAHGSQDRLLLGETRSDQGPRTLSSEFADVVERSCCLRKVLTEFGLAGEIGGWHRFTGPHASAPNIGPW